MRYLCTALVYKMKAARMVESVDTRDLKSLGHYGCAGSSPAPSTIDKRATRSIVACCTFYFSPKGVLLGGLKKMRLTAVLVT